MNRLLSSFVVPALSVFAIFASSHASGYNFSTSDGKGKIFEIAIRIEGITFSQDWATIKPGDYRGQFSFDCDTNGLREKGSVNYNFTLYPQKHGVTEVSFHWTEDQGSHGWRMLFVQDGPPDFTPQSTWDHYFMARACYIEPISKS